MDSPTGCSVGSPPLRRSVSVSGRTRRKTRTAFSAGNVALDSTCATAAVSPRRITAPISARDLAFPGAVLIVARMLGPSALSAVSASGECTSDPKLSFLCGNEVFSGDDPRALQWEVTRQRAWRGTTICEASLLSNQSNKPWRSVVHHNEVQNTNGVSTFPSSSCKDANFNAWQSVKLVKYVIYNGRGRASVLTDRV